MRAFPRKQRGFWQFFIPVVASLFGAVAAHALADTSTPKLPEPPKAPEPVAPMPTIDDEAQKSAKRRSLLEQSRRRGRASTILSDPLLSDQPLGG